MMTAEAEPQSVEDQLRGENAALHLELGQYYQKLRVLLQNHAICPRCAELLTRWVLADKP